MAKKEIQANEWCRDYFRRPEWPGEPTLKEGHMPSPTEQSHMDACDINQIIKRYEQGIIPDHLSSGPGNYGDFSDITSYSDALDAVKAANDAFMALPGEMRAKFHHDPGAFIDFCEDPANYEEMVKMGLIERKVSDKSSEVAHESGSGKKASRDASNDSPDTSKKA